MTLLATDGSRAQAGRLPFAGRPVQLAMHVYVFSMFVISTNILDMIGYDYSAIGGSPITKIHISTYVIVLAFGLLVLTYENKPGLAHFYMSTKLGTLYFFAAATVAFVNIVAGRRNGFGMYFDTHLNLFCCCMVLPFIELRLMDRLERFIHWFFLANALTALAEFAAGENFFPVVVHSTQGDSFDTRMTAFLSHPLHAATLTSSYIVCLLAGGGPMLKPSLRAPMILLQLAAMVAFGGRTALLLTLSVICLALLWKAMQFAAGKRVSPMKLIGAILAIPAGAVALGVLGYLGFFDQFFTRFVEDSGSARTRVLMFELLADLKFADVVWGADAESTMAEVVAHGLEWGVENPYIGMIVYQGLVMATFVITGFLALLRDVYVRLERAAIAPIVVFVAICNSFGSFSSRFFAASIFIVIVSTLFRRRDVNRVI